MAEVTKTPEEEMLKADRWLTYTSIAAMIIQTAGGLMAFLYLLLARLNVATPSASAQSNLNPFTLLLVFSISLGIAWGVLVYVWFAWSKALQRRRMVFGSFLTFYTFFYALWLAWYSFWVNINGKDDALAPKPGTIGFISYAGLQIFILFGTIFFDTYAWRVVYSEITDYLTPAEPQTVPAENNWIVTWMTAFAIIACLAGFAVGIWGFFEVLNYNMSSMWVPLGILIGYFVLEGIAFIMYAYVNMQRFSTVSSAKELFKNHWREVDSIFVFLSFSWVVNMGFAIQFWSGMSKAELNTHIHFPPSFQYYWVVVSFCIINAIFLPVYMYSAVTILCMVPWMKGEAAESGLAIQKEKTFLGVLGQPFFGMAYVYALSATTASGKQKTMTASLNSALKWIFIFFLYGGLLYQILLAFFTYYDLLHTKYTYISTIYKPWYIAALVIQCVFWFVYFVYALATTWLAETGRSSTVTEKLQESGPFRTANSFLYCQLWRPVATFAVVVFLETFAYAEVYDRLHFTTVTDPAARRALIADPAQEDYLMYNGSFIIIFGLIYGAILSFKDMISSVFSQIVQSNESLQVRLTQDEGGVAASIEKGGQTTIL